jgi:uncharacterized protein
MRKVYVKNSSIEGKGIFASKVIKRGEIISYFKGEKYKITNQSKQDALANPNWIAVGKNTWMDTNPPLRFTNHSCNPNASIKGKVTLVALRNIQKNEEVTIDYSITEGDPRWFMKCLCGEKKCRKVVSSVQSLPYEIYKRYLPFVPRFTQSLYKKLIQNKNG